jgi:hypothetical protein
MVEMTKAVLLIDEWIIRIQHYSTLLTTNDP